MSFTLAACSGPSSPSLGVDDSTTVSSIAPETTADDMTNYAAPADPVESADLSSDPLDTSDRASTERKRLPMIDEEPINQTTIPDNGVNMDAALGVDQPVGLAEEQSRDIAEGQTTQPVVDGIGTETLSERQPVQRNVSERVDFQDASTAGEIRPSTRRRTTGDQTEIAMLPRTADPLDEAPVFNQMSASERNCRQDLKKMGVRFEEVPPISKGNSCGIANPIKVIGLQGGIQMKPAATMNCQMTRMFARWVRNELVPSARNRYFSGVQSIKQLSSYSCRKMNSRSSNPWSEHAIGNALDIGGFTLNNGKVIDVRKKSFFAFREKGLLKTVREDSCKYFTTVLGPGDAYHGEHFHFDLRARKSGYRYCSL